MSKYNVRLLIILCALPFVLISCKRSQSEPTSSTLAPDAVRTAAAQTADARYRATVAISPTNTPLPPLNTAESTQVIAATQSVTATVLVQPTQATPTPTGMPVPSLTPTAMVGNDQAVFTGKETVPDGTDFAPGTKFTKSWQFINKGQTTWTGAYSFVFVSGEQIGGPASVAVPIEVPPGAVVDIQVELMAPAKSGSYKGWWRLRNPAGQFFGDSVYVQISVGGSGGSTVPTSVGNGSVTSVSISIDNPSFTGECPHTFTVIGSLTTNGSTTVTYGLEAGGFSLTLPPVQTASFGTGSYSFTYYLEITASGTGWVRLHVTAPNDLVSSQETFTLNCQP
jgi:hypothetical protein